ncbi:putative phosphotransferase YvkC [Nymphon striatum]|nr:putative phosphotransferase YvkC [Nymphon striatum]
MEQIICAGIFSSLTIIIYTVHKYLFHKPSLKEYEHPYKEPGYGYTLRYFTFWIKDFLFRKHSKRFNNFNVHSDDPFEFGVFPSDVQVQLESTQNVEKSSDMDEISFMGVNPSKSNNLHVSLAKRTNNQSEAVISFVVNEDGKRKEFELPQLPRTLSTCKPESGKCWTCQDLKIWNLKSLKSWKISFNGLLREKTSNEVSHVVFNFVWSSYSRVIDHKDDISSTARIKAFALSDDNNVNRYLDNVLDQYDQWGSFFGTYMIDDGPETEMILFGSKIRRTGNFRLSDINRLIQIKGYVEDGSTFSINAINVPYKIPEMIWGYVELGDGHRNLLTFSDFDLLRFKDMDSSPEMLSIRFKTNGDEYILDMTCHNGNFTHLWGAEEDLTAKCNNLKVCLTSLYHGVRLKGSGMFSVLSKNDIHLEAPKKIPPLLLEPDNVSEHIESKNILEFSEEYCQSSKLVGGKGSSLAMLKQIKSDFLVPDGFCITVSANNKHVLENEQLKKKIDRISDICCLENLFKESKLSNILTDEIRQEMVKLFGEKFENMAFGVRSSAIGEDGEEMSAAGQMETILGCRGLEQIFQGIKKCWASCFGFRAVEYRRQNGQPINIGMGVVVQEMVAADTAGVLFTRDPVNGNPAVISIAANYGIGEFEYIGTVAEETNGKVCKGGFLYTDVEKEQHLSVVSAMSEPDSVVVKRTYDNKLSLGERTIGMKKLKIIMKENGGVEESQTSEEDTKSCCLHDEEAMKLAEVGILVEQSYGNPRDIEWAIYNGTLFLLQARPITNLHNDSEYMLKNEFNTSMFSEHDCATSGNIKFKMNKLFGMTRPMNPLATLGFVNCQTHMFNNRSNMMYGNNIKGTAKVMKILTKYKNGMDISMDGRIFDNRDVDKRAILRYKYGTKFSLFSQMLFGYLINFSSKGNLNKAIQKYLTYEMSFEHCNSNKEIYAYLKKILKPQIETFSAHSDISLCSSSANTQVLMSLLGEDSDFKETHYGDFALLLAIESGNTVLSADVPSALQNLAKEIIKKSDFEKFIQMSKEEGEKFLASDESPVKECYRDFIEKHGHRCVKELDIYSTTWSMDPSKLVSPLQTIVRSRNKVENKKLNIDEALDRLQTTMTAKQRKSLRKQVLKAREFVGLREEAKSLLIRTLDQYRKQWRKFAKKLVTEGRLPDENLLFFMSFEEIEDLLKTRSAKIIQRAMRRKRLHPQLERLRFPEICIGIPRPLQDNVVAPDLIDGSLNLKGVPVGRGVVEGFARVVLHVNDAHIIQNDDILVTNATDIAWSPYFPSLSGVVTELGGLVSHVSGHSIFQHFLDISGAVVAREYGIPCVVGVTNATIHIKSGDKIRLNGNDGSIIVLSN